MDISEEPDGGLENRHFTPFNLRNYNNTTSDDDDDDNDDDVLRVTI